MTFVAFPAPRWALCAWALLALIAAYALFTLPSLAIRWGVAPLGIGLLLGWVGAMALAWRAGDRARLVPLVLLLALLARAAAAWLSAGRVSPGDPHSYLLLAAHLRAGAGLWIDEPYMGVRVWALYPPAYPVLLAGWSALFGAGAVSLVVLASLTDAAAAAVLASIGRAVGAPRAGRRAGLMLLLWPAGWFDAPLAQKESLATLLVLLIARGWLASRPPAAAIGAAAGLLALTQPGWAPLAGLLALLQWRRLGMRQLAAALAVMGATAALVMAPWWLRNAWRLGAFVPLTSAGGLSLWIGNHEGASGVWEVQPRAWHGLGELRYAARAATEAKAWIAAHPLSFAWLSLAKLLRATGPGEFALVRLAAMQPGLSAAAGALLFPLLQGAQSFTWAASLAAARWRADPAHQRLLLLLALALAQLGFGLWFEFGERHRAFLTPLLLLLVARWAEGRFDLRAQSHKETKQRALMTSR